MDRAGTLNLVETRSVLNPLDLSSVQKHAPTNEVNPAAEVVTSEITEKTRTYMSFPTVIRLNRWTVLVTVTVTMIQKRT